jgi:hypothetical protein
MEVLVMRALPQDPLQCSGAISDLGLSRALSGARWLCILLTAYLFSVFSVMCL